MIIIIFSPVNTNLLAVDQMFLAIAFRPRANLVFSLMLLVRI
jgi:hypothetical protein